MSVGHLYVYEVKKIMASRMGYTQGFNDYFNWNGDIEASGE
jgi:hypothetical protein